ncbi:hypothetical protein EV586_10469 [Tumebacillus sp. BK434]|uniref:hypothetical protein n=1 Tax=Tumebacillus sp. BK434 TaxID=2512169 RepID=UPI0010461E17|nr:hypothetical protein [Tumebacillus sp. BK434]TCP54451.1 hypothetical protein EV586_10469 [Tumebacillus sp. BK434]
MNHRPIGGRLHPRPLRVVSCPSCSLPQGRNYHACPDCYRAVEAIWLKDWEALLNKEGIRAGQAEERQLAEKVVAELDLHPWTVVDAALTFVTCTACGQEPGGGPLSCEECAMLFGNLWGYDVEAQHQGRMTGNEHALRVGRRVLRHPHRQKPGLVRAWKFSMPILLTGQVPSHEIAAYFKRAIDKAESESFFEIVYQSFEEAYLTHRSSS